MLCSPCGGVRVRKVRVPTPEDIGAGPGSCVKRAEALGYGKYGCQLHSPRPLGPNAVPFYVSIKKTKTEKDNEGGWMTIYRSTLLGNGHYGGVRRVTPLGLTLTLIPA